MDLDNCNVRVGTFDYYMEYTVLVYMVAANLTVYGLTTVILESGHLAVRWNTLYQFERIWRSLKSPVRPRWLYRTCPKGLRFNKLAEPLISLQCINLNSSAERPTPNIPSQRLHFNRSGQHPAQIVRVKLHYIS